MKGKMTNAPRGRFSRANGVLHLDLGDGKQRTVYGGPFHHCPEGEDLMRVCLLEKDEDGDADVHLPIPDFGVPESREQTEGALKSTLRAMLRGYTVWAGCLGGFGRTGTFLALLAKAAGYGGQDPTRFVRKCYTPRAVENPKQEDYVAAFDVSRLQGWLHAVTRGPWYRRLWFRVTGA